VEYRIDFVLFIGSETWTALVDDHPARLELRYTTIM